MTLTSRGENLVATVLIAASLAFVTGSFTIGQDLKAERCEVQTCR